MRQLLLSLGRSNHHGVGGQWLPIPPTMGSQCGIAVRKFPLEKAPDVHTAHGTW